MSFFFFKQKTAYEMRISDWSSDVCSSDLCPCRHRKNHAHGGYGRIVTPIDRIAPIARQLRPSFLVSQYVAITRFKRHIAFPADIVEMRSRVVLALRPARHLDHDLRGTADNASKPRPRVPALARSEEHPSEIKSLMRISYAVFRLKKKNTNNIINSQLVTYKHIEHNQRK